jgi:hypothetical protein
MELGDNVPHKIQPYISYELTYDLILGMDWLYRYNPHINWQRNRLIYTIQVLDDDVSLRRPTSPRNS